MLRQEKFTYQHNNIEFKGSYVYNAAIAAKRPGVLIAHDWSGNNDFSLANAEKLAQLGYVGICIDMYGAGKTGTTKEEKMALMQPLMQDRNLLQARILAALQASRNISVVDTTQIAAVGFCFGGLCVLDLARSGADVKGGVSVHGLLTAPELKTQKTIAAKILVLHGYADPMVPPDAVVCFCNEMTNANADWQTIMYGHAKHAFANPKANDAAMGTVYDAKTAARAWTAIEIFLKEIFT